MIQIETSVHINRPVKQVAGFMSENENALLWQAGLLETRRTSEANGEGSTWTDVMKVFGRRIELSFIVTEYIANEKIAFKSTSGPISVAGSYILKPDKEGTEVIFALKGEPDGFFKLAEPVIKRMTLRQWETNLANLKELLETESVSLGSATRDK
jgi:uncharacterized membrane protein